MIAGILDTSRYLVTSGTGVALTERDPAATTDFSGGKKEGRRLLGSLIPRIEALQELLYAQGKHRLLVVIQAMDTGGKDGVIRKVFEGVNPTGVRVTSFKQPTPHELEHDYLWRIHPHVPANGGIAIFNRSHYEDVLVVRVGELVPEARWRPRFEQINGFERMLAAEGTTILKFFLHISKEEQRGRLQARLDDPTKRWKFNQGDLEQRIAWDGYQQAYEEAMTETSTEWAPWYVVPADRKWYRDLVVASVLVETLESMGLAYPEPELDLDGIVVE